MQHYRSFCLPLCLLLLTHLIPGSTAGKPTERNLDYGEETLGTVTTTTPSPARNTRHRLGPVFTTTASSVWQFETDVRCAVGQHLCGNTSCFNPQQSICIVGGIVCPKGNPACASLNERRATGAVLPNDGAITETGGPMNALTSWIQANNQQRTVTVINSCGSNIRLKCESGDIIDSIDWMTVEDHAAHVFTFRDNIWGTTLFWCQAQWDRKRAKFNVYGGDAGRGSNNLELFGYGIYLNGYKKWGWSD